MKIIPAVDIKNGKCVRLSQGKADQETIYSDHPQEMADHWDEEGAQLIHVVDLDGAFEGSPKNSKIVKEIIYSSSVDIQVGGGIRTLAAIEEYVNAGVYRIILGTIAQKEPEFVEQACKKFPGKIRQTFYIYEYSKVTHENYAYKSQGSSQGRIRSLAIRTG